MKLVKSLLLGTVAALAAGTVAQAADLPSRKAAPVEYVRVCSAYGAGFFFIPGTETCLRVSGRVRAEYRYFETFGRAADATGYRARAQLNLDARTQTAYGTLRTFFRFEHTRNGGNYGAAGQLFNTQAVTLDLNKAFIQWAGITAGRATSFFDFYANTLNFGRLAGSDTYGSDPVVLAYTATFGSGFSATLSLEDPTARRQRSAIFANEIAFAGQRMPDIIANLRVDQAWGSAQLSGGIHQLNATNRVPAAVNPAQPYVDTEYGYGIQGGVKINLPMIAAGDQLWLQAAYAEGANNFVHGGVGIPNLGGVNITGGDAYIDGFGNVKKAKSFGVTAAFLHYWTPQVRQSLFGSYARVDYASAVETPVNALTGARPAGALTDSTEFRVGTNVIWSPVPGFDIGVEVLYARIDPKGRVVDVNKNNGATKGSDDAFEARLRIQRDF
jgi:Porin subfamily